MKIVTKHYDKEQWLQYINDALDGESREEMEAHLFGCDDCLERFTSLLAEQEVLQVDFTAEVMDSLPADRPAPRPMLKTVTPQFRRRMIWCYAAAAAATLVITFTGAFTNLGEGLAQALPASATALTEWTGQITAGLNSIAAPKSPDKEDPLLNPQITDKDAQKTKLQDILADWLKGGSSKPSSQSEKETKQ